MLSRDLICRGFVLALGALCACATDAPALPTDTGPGWDCEPDSRPGEAGITDGAQTRAGFLYNVRTPDDYDPTVAIPLLMVYAPAGGQAGTTETFTGLTPDALARGWMVAYANHVSPQSVEAVQPLADIAVDITETWCVDTERVYLTGHSDGGSADHIIAGFEQLPFAPAGMAPSAAGISAGTLTQFTCPDAAIPTLVLHSRNDGLFPVSDGFGRGAAVWWADCNGCDATASAPDANGCERWSACTDDAAVMYCQNTGSHGTWPRQNALMLDFLGGE